MGAQVDQVDLVNLVNLVNLDPCNPMVKSIWSDSRTMRRDVPLKDTLEIDEQSTLPDSRWTPRFTDALYAMVVELFIINSPSIRTIGAWRSTGRPIVKMIAILLHGGAVSTQPLVGSDHEIAHLAILGRREMLNNDHRNAAILGILASSFHHTGRHHHFIKAALFALFALLSLVRVVNPVAMVHLGGGAGLRVGAAGS